MNTPDTLLTKAAAMFPFDRSVCTESSKDKFRSRSLFQIERYCHLATICELVFLHYLN